MDSTDTRNFTPGFNLDAFAESLYAVSTASALEDLPYELQHTLVELRNMDETYQDALRSLNEKRREYLRALLKRGKAPVPAESEATLIGMRTEVDRLQTNAVLQCDEKIALTNILYEHLSKHIENVDAELAKLGDYTFKKISPSERSSVGEKKANKKRMMEAGSPAVKQIYASDSETIDSDEPTYCICNQISFGEMVACDNKNCAKEWFHFECVGLIEQPSGKWFCSECLISKEKQRARDKVKKRKKSHAALLGNASRSATSASPGPPIKVKSEPSV